MTKVYHYDPLTYEFLCSDIADLDPLEGKLLVPAHATLIPPPPVLPGMALVFSSDKWEEVEDHRGTVYSTKTGLALDYTDLGPLPAEVTDKPPTLDSKWDATSNNWVSDPTKVAERYKQKRVEAYPPMTDYLDAVVKGDTLAQQEYIDACLAVKAKYPKLRG